MAGSDSGRTYWFLARLGWWGLAAHDNGSTFVRGSYRAIAAPSGSVYTADDPPNATASQLQKIEGALTELGQVPGMGSLPRERRFGRALAATDEDEGSGITWVSHGQPNRVSRIVASRLRSKVFSSNTWPRRGLLEQNESTLPIVNSMNLISMDDGEIAHDHRHCEFGDAQSVVHRKAVWITNGVHGYLEGRLIAMDLNGHRQIWIAT